MNQSGHDKIVIFDLDGTLAIIDKRRLKAGKTVDGKETEKMDWDIFHDPSNIHLDEPNGKHNGKVFGKR